MPAERPAPHLVVESLAAGYGGPPVVRNLDLTVGRGEVVSIVGPNGAGKSTLLKALVGIIRTTEGRVTLDGADVTNAPTEVLARQGIGYIPQIRDVFATLTVRENLELGGYLLDKRTRAERIEEVLALFEALRPLQNRHALRLSGGERKMLAIGRVLMLRPTLLVLDEPTAGLSPTRAHSVLHEHVRRLADLGAAVLIVEQKALEAMEISDWTQVLVAGETAVEGPSSELLERPDIREVFLGSAATTDVGRGLR